MTTISLVVMEPASEWPAYVRNSETVVAIGGALEELLHRTRQELDSLRRHCRVVGIAVLACNGVSDHASAVCRAELVDELLRALTHVAFGRLVLSAASHASTRARRELLSLAEASSQRLRGTAITVSVSFGDRLGGQAELRTRWLQ